MKVIMDAYPCNAFPITKIPISTAPSFSWSSSRNSSAGAAKDPQRERREQRKMGQGVGKIHDRRLGS
jgi:hypothetical protein